MNSGLSVLVGVLVIVGVKIGVVFMVGVVGNCGNVDGDLLMWMNMYVIVGN